MAELGKAIPPRLGTIQVNVSNNVTSESLASIIGHIGGMVGCRTCGLIGIDLIFRNTGDPEQFGGISSLPGVRNVSLGQ